MAVGYEEDARFIAGAREWVPALLAKLESAENALSALDSIVVDACEERDMARDDLRDCKVQLTQALNGFADAMTEQTRLRTEGEARDRRIRRITELTASLRDRTKERNELVAAMRQAGWHWARSESREAFMVLDNALEKVGPPWEAVDGVLAAGGDTSNPRTTYEGTHACIGCGQPYITTTDKLPGYREFCDGCLVVVAKKLAWFFNEPDVDSMMEPAQYALGAIIESAADGSVPEPTTTKIDGFDIKGMKRLDQAGDVSYIVTIGGETYRGPVFGYSNLGESRAVSGPVSTEGK
jgi:hypothetical protein